jgi:hypothetical protein
MATLVYGLSQSLVAMSTTTLGPPVPVVFLHRAGVA